MRPPNWMLWNLLLAAVPLVLGTVLFRWAPRRTVIWWCWVAVFVAFLPNAPYVLSDGVHLAARLRLNPSWARTLLLVAGFGAFCFVGMEAYVLSIGNVRSYLRREGLSRLTVPVVIGLHALSAVGIYLGRIARFNSWDLIAGGNRVLAEVHRSLLHPWPLALVAFTFVVTVVAYEVLQRINVVAGRVGARRAAP